MHEIYVATLALRKELEELRQFNEIEREIWASEHQKSCLKTTDGSVGPLELPFPTTVKTSL